MFATSSCDFGLFKFSCEHLVKCVNVMRFQYLEWALRSSVLFPSVVSNKNALTNPYTSSYSSSPAVVRRRAYPTRHA